MAGLRIKFSLLLQQAPDLALIKILEMKSVPFEGRVGSLEVREGAEDLVTNRIQAYSLIETAADFWGETNYKEGNPNMTMMLTTAVPSR